jgi:Fe-S-cluster containining protein
MTQDLPKTLPMVDWALPQGDPVAELDRQMERGSQFTQAALDKVVARLAGAEEYINELVGLLKARGLLSEADLADEGEEAVSSPEIIAEGTRGGSLPEAAAAGDDRAMGDRELATGDRELATGDRELATGDRELATGDEEEEESEPPHGAVASENGRGAETAHERGTFPNENGVFPTEGGTPRNEGGTSPNENGTALEDGASDTHAKVNWPGIAFRVDPEEPAPPVQVNCAERMHVCHAVCCKLNFALTPEEVEAGKVKWDLGFPYLIRHASNGYCCHNDTATGRCTVYADRPGVCHRYSCANDKRIWKDFDNMVLNEEWIRANLSNQTRITVRAGLPLMDVRTGNGAAPNGHGAASGSGSVTA